MSVAVHSGRLRAANAHLMLEPKHPPQNGLTPLHVAAHYDNQKVALLLLEKGASPHATAKVRTARRSADPTARGSGFETRSMASSSSSCRGFGSWTVESGASCRGHGTDCICSQHRVRSTAFSSGSHSLRAVLTNECQCRAVPSVQGVWNGGPSGGGEGREG